MRPRAREISWSEFKNDQKKRLQKSKVPNPNNGGEREDSIGMINENGVKIECDRKQFFEEYDQYFDSARQEDIVSENRETITLLS